jgi:hypothetical protein
MAKLTNDELMEMRRYSGTDTKYYISIKTEVLVSMIDEICDLRAQVAYLHDHCKDHQRHKHPHCASCRVAIQAATVIRSLRDIAEQGSERWKWGE